MPSTCTRSFIHNIVLTDACAQIRLCLWFRVAIDGNLTIFFIDWLTPTCFRRVATLQGRGSLTQMWKWLWKFYGWGSVTDQSEISNHSVKSGKVPWGDSSPDDPWTSHLMVPYLRWLRDCQFPIICSIFRKVFMVWNRKEFLLDDGGRACFWDSKGGKSRGGPLSNMSVPFPANQTFMDFYERNGWPIPLIICHGRVHPEANTYVLVTNDLKLIEVFQ